MENAFNKNAKKGNVIKIFIELMITYSLIYLEDMDYTGNNKLKPKCT